MRATSIRAGLAGLAALTAVAAASFAPAASDAASAGTGPVPRAATSNLTPFGYNATVFGTKVVVGGAEVRTLKDALINRGCTRQAGLDETTSSLLSTAGLPDAVQKVLSLSLSTSSTHTYHDAATGRYGVRGVNDLGDVSLGGVTVAGVPLPKVTLKGLESTADSYFDAKAGKAGKAGKTGKAGKAGTAGDAGRFGHHESFGYQGLSLELPSGGPISDSLRDLLGLLGIDPDDIPPVVDVPVQTLVQVLTRDLASGLVIPHLLTIRLGQAGGLATATGASSNAYALAISLDRKALGLDQPVSLQLGRATSTISRPVLAGVFRSSMSALEANVADVVNYGGVSQRSLPCEGTGGKTVTQHVAGAGVPGLLSLSGITYAYSGKQVGKQASGFVSTTLGDVSVPAVGLDIKGLAAKVTMKSNRPGRRVTSYQYTHVAQILIDGKPVAIPQQGQTMRYQNSDGAAILLQRTLLGNVTRSQTFYGTKLTALRVTLPGVQNGITIDLGVANGEVFFR